MCVLASTGEPASSPRNSPTCHCRVSIQSASRTSERSAREKSTARGRPSTRFHIVTVGKSRRSSAAAIPVTV